MFEKLFGPDDLSIEKARLVGLLEREGLTDAVREEIIRWTKEREIRSEISPKERIRFNFDRAELYEAAKWINEMFECLDEALYQARQEGFPDLEEIIDGQIQEMDVKYPPKP